MRCLAFIIAEFNFLLVALHIKGIENDLAHTLSRDNMHYNYSQAKVAPTVISQSLADLLIGSKPDWTSATWTRLWSSTFKTPSTHMPQLRTQFCSEYNFPVLPVSENQLCQYVPFLAEAGLSHDCINQMLLVSLDCDTIC